MFWVPMCGDARVESGMNESMAVPSRWPRTGYWVNYKYESVTAKKKDAVFGDSRLLND